MAFLSFVVGAMLAFFQRTVVFLVRKSVLLDHGEERQSAQLDRWPKQTRLTPTTHFICKDLVEHASVCMFLLFALYVAWYVESAPVHTSWHQHHVWGTDLSATKVRSCEDGSACRRSRMWRKRCQKACRRNAERVRRHGFSGCQMTVSRVSTCSSATVFVYPSRLLANRSPAR